MKMHASLAIRAVTSLEEFKGLAQPWEQLLRTVPVTVLFFTWEWMYYWAKHFLGENRLWIIPLLDGGQRVRSRMSKIQRRDFDQASTGQLIG